MQGLNSINALQFYRLMRFGAMLFISILLTKSGIATAEISWYEWLLYIGTAASVFWINGFLAAILPVYPGLSKADQSAFLFNVFLQFCGFSLLVFLVLYLGKSWLLPALTSQDTLPYYETFCWFLLFNLPTALIEYNYLLCDRPRWIVYFGILSFSLQVVAMIGPVFLGWGLGWSINLLLIVAIFRFLWLLLWVLKNTELKWRFDLLRPYIYLALPLIFYTFMASFAQLFDSWLVGWYFDDPDLFAIFRYGARELPLATALVGGVFTALVPEVATNLEAALVRIKAASRRMYHWLFPLSILLLLTSNYWFPRVFNANFQQSAAIFNLYLLIMISRVIMSYTVVMGLKKTKIILWVSIGEAVVNIVLSFLLVRYFGLEGIALATVLAFLFEKVALSLYLRLKHGIAFRQYTDLRLFYGYSVLLLLAFYWMRFVV